VYFIHKSPGWFQNTLKEKQNTLKFKIFRSGVNISKIGSRLKKYKAETFAKLE